jgi:hypothetical protein
MLRLTHTFETFKLSAHHHQQCFCLWPSSRAIAAPTPLAVHRVKLAPGTCITFPCLPSTEAKRSGRAFRSGEGGFVGLPRLRQANSHARRRRPSGAQRPGRVERRRGFGVFLLLRHKTARPSAEESQAQRPGRAQRRKGFGGLPRLQLARTPKNVKPTAAARTSAAERGRLQTASATTA